MRSVGRLARVVGSLVVVAVCFRPAAAQAPRGVECEKCHANRDFLASAATRPGSDTTLFVRPGILDSTVHRGLRCVDCHRGSDAGYPHRPDMVAVPCQTCHEQPGRDWGASIHAVNAQSRGDAPTCVACHGSHRILSAKDPKSPTFPLNVAGLCGRCHGDARIIGRYFTGPGKEQARIATTAFATSVHGIALTRDGLVVSATCPACHQAHRVLPADSAGSTVNRANIPATCGQCHAGVTAVYDSSAHGPAYPAKPGAGKRHPRPVCVDCHSAHEIGRADRPQWKLGTVEKCGGCHEELYQTYFETYHGQVSRLGAELAAKCSDCHTPHNMRSALDPKSTVFATNLVNTCGRCHPGANANFTRYYAHGDPKQRGRYPLLYWPYVLMTGLLVSVMSFFGVHSVLWLLRTLVERRRRGGPRGEEPPTAPADGASETPS